MKDILVTAAEIITTDGKYPERLKFATSDIMHNAEITAKKMTQLLQHYGKRPPMSSGFRDPASNKKVGGASSSAHCSGEAVDWADKGLSVWCLKNVGILAQLGIYVENPAKTPSWCHTQTRKTKSGRIIFDP